MFSQFGPLEIILVLVIVLVIFGPKRLPGLGKQLGTGMREFKDSITGNDKDAEPPAEESRPALAKAQPQEPARSAAEREPVEPAREPRG
jgi:sec-independent protein translocase protein TatA